MEERLIIDGRDIGAYYRAWLTEGGLNALLSWPAAKAVDTVAWAESDFAEADLSELHLAGREATVGFGMKGHPTDVAALCSWLGESVYREWDIASIGRTYTLRYTGNTGLDAAQFSQTFGVGVAVDSPLDGYEYLAPVSHIAESAEYELDGVRLSEYGVRVLLGTLDTTALHPGVKERLKRDISTVDGVIYDGDATNVLRAQEITLRCALIDPTLAGAWRNYDALLHDLVKQNQSVVYDTDKCRRSLYSQRLSHSFDCYYKSQSVTEFSPWGGRVWVLFNIVLGVVGSAYTPAYLATEADAWVKTENGFRIRI